MTTLYEYLKAHQDVSQDVADEKYDTIVGWDYTDDEPGDWYEVVHYIERNVNVLKENMGPYAKILICDFHRFVRANLDVLKEFSKEWNNEYYQIKGRDDQSIYNGIETIFSFWVGNYPPECDEVLAIMFGLKKPKRPASASRKPQNAKKPVKARNTRPSTDYSVIYDGSSIYDASTLEEAMEAADRSASYMWASDYQDPWSDHVIVRNSDGKKFDTDGKEIGTGAKRPASASRKPQNAKKPAKAGKSTPKAKKAVKGVRNGRGRDICRR